MLNKSVLILSLFFVIHETYSFSIFGLFETTKYRLPNTTVPISYDIHLTTKVHEKNFRFNGTVIIDIVAVTDAREIVLHAVDLKITKIKLVEKGNGHEFKNLAYDMNEKNGFLKIFARYQSLNLKAGVEYVLTVYYVGTHKRKDAEGFFALQYKTREGDDVWMAATHFEPTYARLAFPCYDEPALKARFAITLTHFCNFTALSNMLVDGESIKCENDMTTTKFKRSPLMSSYIVAFVLTNSNSITQKPRGVTHRVFSPPISKEKGNYSIDVASKALHHLEDYFGIKYPLPKMDHISIPNLSYSAMENWGLIIYQYGSLLPSSQTSTLYNMGTANVIAHEITHQWFGNLVSPKWWKWTWLNEGLTTYYSNKVMDMIYPEWKAVEYGLFKEGEAVVWSDQERTLTREVKTVKEIWSTFSFASYFKAAYVLRMFEHALTESTFKKGIILYLKEFQYSSAEENDLFESLQKAALEDRREFFDTPGQVQKMMSSWTNQKGIPIVQVTRHYKTGTVIFRQTSTNQWNVSWLHKVWNFLTIEQPQYWWIPITFTTSKSIDFSLPRTELIFPNISTMHLDLKDQLGQDDWIVLNKQQIGVYRVLYDNKNWELIIMALKNNPKIMHPYNKGQLIRDAMYFMKKGALPIDILLDLLEYLKNEEEIYPWYEGVQVLGSLLEEYQSKSSKKLMNLETHVQSIVYNIFKKFGVDHVPGEPPMVELLRPKIFNLACNAGLQECKDIVDSKFEAILSGTGTTSVFMASAIYCQYLKNANEEEMNKFYEHLLSERPYPFEKRELYLIELFECNAEKDLIFFILEYLDIDIFDVLKKAMQQELDLL